MQQQLSSRYFLHNANITTTIQHKLIRSPYFSQGLTKCSHYTSGSNPGCRLDGTAICNMPAMLKTSCKMQVKLSNSSSQLQNFKQFLTFKHGPLRSAFNIKFGFILRDTQRESFTAQAFYRILPTTT